MRLKMKQKSDFTNLSIFIIYSRMSRNITVFCFLLSLTSFFSINIFAQKLPTQQKDSLSELSESINKQIQNDEKEINNILNEINELIKAGLFDKAAPKFKIIDNKYQKLGKTDYTENKLKELKIIEADFYEKWSTHLDAQANAAYNKKEWSTSIKLANESINLLNKSGTASSFEISKEQNLIKKSEKQIANENFQRTVSLSNFIPDNEQNKFDIDLNFIKAETFLKNKQYEQARDVLEQILVIDTYNFRAMYMLKNLYSKLFKVGQNRTDAEYTDMMAQVNWAYSQQISPELTRADEQLTRVIVSDKKDDRIRDKLQNIIIEKLDFDDATVSSVITYLNRESKRLDELDGAGINIVLRLDNNTEDDLERITMAMDEVPFEVALKYICLATGLRYRIEEHAVIIGNESIEELKTEFFSVKSDIINSIASDISIKEESEQSDTEGNIMGSSGFGDEEITTVELTMEMLITYFTNRGVPFPADSAIAWDVRANTLTVTNTPENLRILEKLLKEIDIEIPLVLIETKFVEITETDLKEFGFDWDVNYSSGILQNGAQWGINQFANNANIVQPTPATTTNGNNSILNHLTNKDGDSQGALINNLTFDLPAGAGQGALSFWLYAMDQNNIAEILSAPKVITKSGTTALIRMVEEEYFPTEWSTPTATTPDGDEGSFVTGIQINQTVPTFEDPTDLGIRLKVTPTVSPNNYTILLDLKPTRTDFLGWTDYEYNVVVYRPIDTTPVTFTTMPFTQPVKMAEIATREVETKVLVYDGTTTVLGGMITDDTTSTDDVIPVLSDIPLVGRLFRSEYKESVKKNLLIFVTARLVKPDGTPFRKTTKNGLFKFGQY